MPGIDESRAFLPLSIAVVTVSDTRSLENDQSGQTLVERLQAAGHRLAARRLVRDDRLQIELELVRLLDNPAVQVILTTGGTGVTGRDVTPEVVHALGSKRIPGF